MKGRNLTLALEHERIHIIPYLLIEVRGTKTVFLLSAIFIPLTAIIVGMFLSNTTLMFLFLFIEILLLFTLIYVLQKETRSKTEHISLIQKFYYEYKNYTKVTVDFKETYYLKSKCTNFPLIIKRIDR